MTVLGVKLREWREYIKGEDADLDNFEVGTVGGPSHVEEGTSYHLGEDQLKMSKNPYSARTARDKAGLANPETANLASAGDVDDDLDELREMSVWIVEECRRPNPNPDTHDLREIIYSPDGITVFTWDREKGQTSAPERRGSASHRTHTHFSWYRDSGLRDKTGVFRRFFNRHNPAGGTDMFEQSDRNTAQADTWRLLTVLEDRDAAQYQLQGEPAPREEENLLKARLVRMEEKIDKLAAAGGGITDEQLERVLRKILIEGVGNPRTVA